MATTLQVDGLAWGGCEETVVEALESARSARTHVAWCVRRATGATAPN
ncbi:hypothetical protein [Halomicrococcus gelatinilyticus]